MKVFKDFLLIPEWVASWLILWIWCATLPCFGLEHALVSVYAVEADTGKVLIAENSDLSLTPASCMKIVTTAAALHILGADSRFETHLELDGSIDETQTLQGNLYIRGGGDPCLGSDRIAKNPSWEKQLQIWADAIQERKIRQIRGKILTDTTRWEKAQAVPSWAWEDLGNYYGAGASALSFHENSYSVFFQPAAKVGQKATLLRTDPPLRHQLINEVSTGPENSGDCASIFGSELSTTQWIRGTIPWGVSEFSIRGAIPDPAACCINLLTEELKKRGIVVQGTDLQQCAKKIALETTISPTIQEIIYWTNQKSINLYAEHLLKKIGEVKCTQGSTEAGTKAITEFWKAQKIDLSGFHMADGSGLSRKNLVTTRQLVDILVKMKKSDNFPIFLESLPQKEGIEGIAKLLCPEKSMILMPFVSGSKAATVHTTRPTPSGLDEKKGRKWLQKGDFNGQMGFAIPSIIKAKSGSMSLVRGLAGYTDKIAFAILINNYTDVQQAEQKIDSTLLQIQQLNQKLLK